MCKRWAIGAIEKYRMKTRDFRDFWRFSAKFLRLSYGDNLVSSRNHYCIAAWRFYLWFEICYILIHRNTTSMVGLVSLSLYLFIDGKLYVEIWQSLWSYKNEKLCFYGLIPDAFFALYGFNISMQGYVGLLVQNHSDPQELLEQRIIKGTSAACHRSDGWTYGLIYV